MKRKRYRIEENGDIYFHTQFVICEVCMNTNKCKIFKSINESAFIDNETTIFLTVALECNNYKQKGASLLDKTKDCKYCEKFSDCTDRKIADSYEGREEKKGIARIIEANFCEKYKRVSE